VTTVSIGELLNLIGLSAGVALYAMLLVMVVRAGPARGARSPVDPVLLVTALLGLVWNLCALTLYELPKIGVAGPFPYVTAVGFGALGFLPAVVVHSVVRGDRHGIRRPLKRAIATLAYGVSASALSLHLQHAMTGGAVPAPLGMQLLTYTFVALVLPLAAVTRRQPGSRRALWAASLATFAVSALHLSQLHQGDAAWPVELVGHHASLPLALAILYQDYPFALADLFLKRALSLLTVAALVFGAIATFSAESAAFARFAQPPRQIATLVILWAATVLVFPALRRANIWFVDTVVLRRPNYRALGATIARRAQTHHDVSGLIEDVCALLAPAVSAPWVSWREWRPNENSEPLAPSVVRGHEAAALAESTARAGPDSESGAAAGETAIVVTVPTSEPPQYVLMIGKLRGGRRFFSDDLAALESVAIIVARRIDAIRLAAERYDRELREREIARLATEAELRALRAQINPHFLFNALTTIGYLIQTAPSRALQTLLRLTSLLRAVLRSEGEFTTLGRELEVAESYLDIERARFEERLAVTIDVPSGTKAIRMPPLILQPLVENAVKHGIANRQNGGEVVIRARLEQAAAGAEELVLTIRDTGAGSTADTVKQGRRTGVGLDNVERRLACQYGPNASLSIQTAIDAGTTVEVRFPVVAAVHAEPESRQAIL
jgi:two-component system LytT family sensor kinase